MKKGVLFIALTVSSAASSLLIQASKVNGVLQYRQVTVVLFSEFLKFVTSACVLLFQNAQGTSKTTKPLSLTWLDLLVFAPAAVLYTAGNNSLFVILRYIEPVTLQLVWNFKIIATALLFRVFLARRLTVLKCLALALLLVGVVTCEIEKLTPAVSTDAMCTVPTNVTIPAELPTSIVDDLEGWSTLSIDEHTSAFLMGTALTLLAATVVAFANVYCEWAFKRHEEGSSFFMKGLQLYFYGIVCNLTALLASSPDYQELQDPFQGYNMFTFVFLANNALGGILAGGVLKVFDSVTCVFAHVCAMLLTVILSALHLGFAITPTFVCGFVTCTIALYIYHAPPPQAAATAPACPNCTV